MVSVEPEFRKKVQLRKRIYAMDSVEAEIEFNQGCDSGETVYLLYEIMGQEEALAVNKIVHL